MSNGTAGAARWRRLELTIQGMDCRHAVRSVTARLRDVVGVETVVADPHTGVVTVTGVMHTADVLAAFDDLPYRAAIGACGCPDP